MDPHRKRLRFRWLALAGASLIAGMFLAGILFLRYAVLKPRLRKAAGLAFMAVSYLTPERVTAQRGDGKPIKYHEVVQPQRFDAWKIIGPGGGGTFYGVTISPFDSSLVIVVSDMTGIYITENAGRTWRELNLRTVAQFVFDRKLPNRILAYTSGAGSYYSDDRGRTWKLFYPEPTSARRLAYVDDESEPYTASTTGHTFNMMSLAVDPDDSNTLYGSWDSSLWVTHDFGKHWKELTKKVAASKLFVDPSSPKDRRSVYVVAGVTTGIWDGTAYKSFKPPEYFGWLSHTAFSIGPNGKPILYAAVGFIARNDVVVDGGVMASEDGGETWHTIALPIMELVKPGTYPSLSAIGASREHPGAIYVAYTTGQIRGLPNQYFGVLKTMDEGAHWEVVTKEYSTGAPNMHDSWITQRFGPDWGDQPRSIFVDDKDPKLVYTTDLGRVMKTTDGGANWEALYSQADDEGYTTTGLDPTTAYGIHFDPFEPKRMFITYTDIGLFRSENSGRSWVSATTNGVPRDWVNTTYWIEFDPAAPGKIWAVMSNVHDIPRWRMFKHPGGTARFHGGVALSLDGGKTWKKSNSGLPEMAATHILLDPKSPPDARVLYVTGFGRGVFKSIDGGQTWTAKSAGLPTTEPLTWRMAMDKNGVLYVTTIRRAQNGKFGTDQDGWVFRSRDGAETWEKMTLPDGLNGPVAVTVDPEDPARLYLSAWGRYTLYMTTLPDQGGVFVSSDGGTTWKNTLNASRRIYDVTIDPKDGNILYATGFEAAAWRSTDRGLTWKRLRGFNFKDAHRVIPDPFDRSKVYITTFGSSVWHGPAEGDPNAVEDIVGPFLMTYDSPGIVDSAKDGKKK